MTRAMALLVTIGMIGVATPTSAHDDECDNRTFFERLLTTRPGAYPDVHRSGSQAPITPDVAEAVDRLVAHLGPLCMPAGGANVGGGDPFLVSDSIVVYELALDFNGGWCNQVTGDQIAWDGGPGGHYENVVPKWAAAKLLPESFEASYIGEAFSGISVASRPYHTEAYVTDMETGEVQAYSAEVRYGGTSDFFCFRYYSPFFHDWLTLNIPQVSGWFGPAVLPEVGTVADTIATLPSCLPGVYIGEEQVGGCDP